MNSQGKPLVRLVEMAQAAAFWAHVETELKLRIEPHEKRRSSGTSGT